MINSMSNLPLVEPLIFSMPRFSLFFLFNLFFSLIGFFSVICLFRFNKSLLVRPAYYCSIGWLLLYQIPLSFFSEKFFESLAHAWRWSIIIHMVECSLLLWCVLTSVKFKTRKHALHFDFPELGLAARWLPVGLLLLMVAIYFRVVPYDCTGLYALWADPWMTLLAREFSIKLIGSSPATYALGAAANIISPLVVAFSIFRAKKFFLEKNYLYFFIWLSFGILAIILVLTSGTKGLLIPTLIMVVAASLLWGGSWVSRVGMLISAIALVASTMVFFELARERDGVAGAKYDFAQCVVETKTCAQSMVLVQSLAHREGSLGLSNYLVKQIDDRLSCMCSSQGDGGQCPAVGVAAYRPKGVDQADRAATLFQAILNRAFAVPFQVGSWHLMYAESVVVDGWKTLPFARRLFGESLNMPALVYQKYGTIYSKGDKTSTSTAPTSFLLYYPSYLGWFGLFVALSALVVWDFIFSFFALRLDDRLFPVAAGIAAITSMNFMSSDFLTVLISHGGAVGLLFVIAFVLLGRSHNNKASISR